MVVAILDQARWSTVGRYDGTYLRYVGTSTVSIITTTAAARAISSCHNLLSYAAPLTPERSLLIMGDA